jgi:hypothetical protein
VINIIKDQEVIFRQISNFSILGVELVNKVSFQVGMITHGYENVRLWKVNNQTGVINSMNVYLGQTNRKVKYNACCVTQTNSQYIAHLCDSNGYLTSININEGKMIKTIKVDEYSLDIIQLQ